MVIALSIVTSALGLIIIPLLVFSFRLAIRWKGVEDKLDQVVRDLDKIVKDKDNIHSELVRQMREDRAATNKRLRWLEENRWSYGTSS